jgi:hypothetical protein
MTDNSKLEHILQYKQKGHKTEDPVKDETSSTRNFNWPDCLHHNVKENIMCCALLQKQFHDINDKQ